MADVAGAVGTFLTLATSWYKEANARGTASATFDNHYKNFNHFHEYVKDPIHGWKSISYDSAGQKKTTVVDGAPVTADGMDEGGNDGGSEMEEGPDGALY